MKELILEFIGTELVKTKFTHPLIGKELKTIRGKSNGAYTDFGSFQWTKAVKAISILGVRAKLFANAGCNLQAMVEGGTLSLAAALDYAIDKQPMWLSDMFGVDSQGKSISKRLFNRTNPGRKRSGPTAISINPFFLPSENLKIYLNGTEVSSVPNLKQLDEFLNLEDEEPQHLNFA